MGIDTRRQVGLIETDKLAAANVLIFGAGAIGSQVAPILLRAGVRNMTLVDGDDVEDHNLNRQFFTPKHVGRNKALAVQQQLKAIDPEANIEAIPNYVKEDQLDKFDLSPYTHIVFAADTLYLEGLMYRLVEAMPAEKRPVFVSPRMNGFTAELFHRDDRLGIIPKNITFSAAPDKTYGTGATCTGPKVEEVKIPAIATTTTFLCSLAAQAVVHSTQGLPFKDHVRTNIRYMFSGETFSAE